MKRITKKMKIISLVIIGILLQFLNVIEYPIFYVFQISWAIVVILFLKKTPKTNITIPQNTISSVDSKL